MFVQVRAEKKAFAKISQICSLILSWTCLTCFLLASSDKIFPQWTHWNPVFWADTVTAFSIFETTSPPSIWGDIIGSFIYQSSALTHIVLWRLWQKTCQKRRSAKVGQSWLPHSCGHQESPLKRFTPFLTFRCAHEKCWRNIKNIENHNRKSQLIVYKSPEGSFTRVYVHMLVQYLLPHKTFEGWTSGEEFGVIQGLC